MLAGAGLSPSIGETFEGVADLSSEECDERLVIENGTLFTKLLVPIG